jgi:hypothetical protein
MSKNTTRRSAFLPFVDACFAQLTERFQKHAAGAYQLSRLLPSFCNDNDFSHIQEAVRLYNQFSPGGLHAARIEFARWKQHWNVNQQLIALRAVLDALLRQNWGRTQLCVYCCALWQRFL